MTKSGAAMKATTLLRALPVKLTSQRPTLPLTESTGRPSVSTPSSIQPRTSSGTPASYRARSSGALACASSHSSSRLLRIWAVCSMTGCARFRSSSPISRMASRKTATAAIGRRAFVHGPPWGSVRSTRRTAGSSM